MVFYGMVIAKHYNGVINMLLELSQGVFIVMPEKRPVYPYCNCMYVADERPAIIDMGAGGRALRDVPCKNIQLALISHFHFDHIHGYKLFPNAAFYTSEEEKTTYADEMERARFYGFDLWGRYVPDTDIEMLFAEAKHMPDDVPEPNFFIKMPVSGFLRDMEKISLGRREITTIHLPGHTSGHYGFWLEKDNVLFSGDIDLVDDGPFYGCYCSDVSDLIASVQRIKEIDPGIIVSAHRYVLKENIREQLDRYIQIIFEREEKIMDLLIEPHNVDRLAMYRLIFPQKRAKSYLLYEKIAIIKHLHHLINTGRIKETEPGLYQRA